MAFEWDTGIGVSIAYHPYSVRYDMADSLSLAIYYHSNCSFDSCPGFNVFYMAGFSIRMNCSL